MNTDAKPNSRQLSDRRRRLKRKLARWFALKCRWCGKSLDGAIMYHASCAAIAASIRSRRK